MDSASTAWILTATALVLLMTIPGLSMFYAGLVRKKNVLSVFMQCFSIVCIATLLWIVFGYSVAFSEGNDFLGGLGNAFLYGIKEDSVHSSGIPESLFVLFQLTFAIITPALIVGGFAERMKFSAVLLFTALWLTVIYFPITHWVWGGGWLAQIGFMDFAGGAVVHITAGVAALVCAVYLGSRKGFPMIAMPPHSLTMTVSGAGLLWVGWFGFNGGSALAANGDAAMAMLVTHIAASVGALAWMTIEWVRYGKPSALGIVTGTIAGLGTITPASGFVGPGGAVVLGLIGGVGCYFATQFIKRRLRIDDSLDVFPVHGVGGFMGILLLAVFAHDEIGVFSGQGLAEGFSIGSQFLVQISGAVVVLLYTCVITWLILKVIDLLIGVRVSEEEEMEGLDLASHEERGYDM